jgi:hypothetical protein
MLPLYKAGCVYIHHWKSLRQDVPDVSNAGHGLLHYAAVFDNLNILDYLLDTYNCDTDRASGLRYDCYLCV